MTLTTENTGINVNSSQVSENCINIKSEEGETETGSKIRDLCTQFNYPEVSFHDHFPLS
jgi:hypothetical protein